MPSGQDIDRFLVNPGEYFDNSLTKMLSVSRDEIHQLQTAGLQRRFAQYRGELPMLNKLADSQNITEIRQLDNGLPLLFDHATYKSYPPSLLERRDYAKLTKWLDKLTTIDLSQVDVSDCQSIDDWMIAIRERTPLTIIHTSGTSGSLSFLPWSKTDWERSLRIQLITYFQKFGTPSPVLTPPLNIDCVYPFFRSGGLGHTVVNDYLVKLFAGSEERFHVAYPGRLSADLSLFAAKRRAAAAKGQLHQLKVDPAIAERHKEFEEQQRELPQRMSEFINNMSTKLAGKRIYMMATSNLLYTVAERGLKEGKRHIFSPDSVIVTGGGGKGIVLPNNWPQLVREFFGAGNLHIMYGMSEMLGQFVLCEHNHYHSLPWIIPFMLDPQSNQPLPRTGTVTGRFAFYDLMPDTRWGGFITGDEVTMTWDKPCACGRTTPYLDTKIQRFSEKKDAGDEKLSCAAAPTAYAEALDFLNSDVK